MDFWELSFPLLLLQSRPPSPSPIIMEWICLERRYPSLHFFVLLQRLPSSFSLSTTIAFLLGRKEGMEQEGGRKQRRRGAICIQYLSANFHLRTHTQLSLSSSSSFSPSFSQDKGITTTSSWATMKTTAVRGRAFCTLQHRGSNDTG